MRYQKTAFALILSIALAGMTTAQAQPLNGHGQREHESRGQQKKAPSTPRPINPAPGTCVSGPATGGYLIVTSSADTNCKVSEISETANSWMRKVVRVIGY